MNRGKYIVLEGAEGVGKTSQLLELARRFQAAGLPFRTLREPDSQSDLTARTIRHLTQDPTYPMNTVTEVLLYNAARSQSLDVIRNSLAQGVHCLVDRNYLTTLAIQYYGRGDVPDYDTINSIISFAVNGLEPDLTVILDAPVPLLIERAKGRGQAERFDNLDGAFLERVRAGYLWEAKQRSLPVVFANEDFNAVADKVWQLVSNTLAQRSEAKPKVTPTTVEPPLVEVESPKEQSDQPLLIKQKDEYQITEAGRKYLEQAVTSVDGDVYAFKDKVSSPVVAAAMARLSRRGDDMRITLLDEFAAKEGKEGDLLKRVITAYGDDSVQQLVGIHLVVENASNLLTKKLEWGRLAAYLEQSTRYIYFDKKDKNGRYRYYTPTTLGPDLSLRYEQIMDQLFVSYSKIVRQLTKYITQTSSVPEAERDGAFKAAVRAQACDAARPLLPVATKSTVGIYASAQSVENLILRLMSDDNAEARQTGEALLTAAREIIPMFLERADLPERGGAHVAFWATNRQAMRDLANKHLGTQLAADQQSGAQLTDVFPRNELDIVPDMLYDHSNLPLSAIREEVAGWSYDQKLAVFNEYIGERLNRRHKPGRAMEKIHYSWDIVCDYGIFRDLQRHRMVEDLEWQQLSPRHGYEIPKIVEEAGLSDDFDNCFDLSLKLYSELQAAGFHDEAQYATLLGHRMRWKITYNARQAFHLHELRTSPQGHPGYRRLILEMHQKVAEIHPNLAAAMRFVNSGEDPKLTRLAAERYSAFKLAKLKEESV